MLDGSMLSCMRDSSSFPLLSNELSLWGGSGVRLWAFSSLASRTMEDSQSRESIAKKWNDRVFRIVRCLPVGYHGVVVNKRFEWIPSKKLPLWFPADYTRFPHELLRFDCDRYQVHQQEEIRRSDERVEHSLGVIVVAL